MEAATVMMIASVASAVAGGVSMISSFQRAGAIDRQAEQAAQAAATARQIGEYNAALAEREGEAARQQAAYEEDRARERGEKLKSAQRAAAGKSGIVWGEGSSVLVGATTAEDIELDALMIRHAGDVNAVAAEAKAAQARFNAQIESTGLINRSNTLRSEAASTRVGGVASLLTGAANAGTVYGRGGTQTPAGTK